MARKKVLAVDDSETMRAMVRMTLSIEYDVIACSDGEEGLKAFIQNQGNISGIVTDINMPKLNGILMIKEIRKLDTDVPILVLTTEIEEPMKKSGAEAGANGWIVKPFKPKAFLDIVRQVLS